MAILIKGLLFFLSVFYFSATWAVDIKLYGGIGATAARSQSEVTSFGSSLSVIPYTAPSNIFQFSAETLAGPPNDVVNSYQTPVASTNGGFKVFLGYMLDSTKRFAIATQVDATLYAGSANSFSQQTTQQAFQLTNDSIQFFETNYSFQLNERCLQSFGLSLLPQWHIIQSVDSTSSWQASLLTLIGYRYGLFKTNWSANSPYLLTANYATHTGRNGLELGLGTQVSLTKHIDLRFMVTQTRYQSVKIFNQPVLAWSVASKTLINEANLALVWTT